MTTERVQLPQRGEAWPALETRLRALGRGDVDWRSGKSAVYVFHPGDEVLEVAKQAYALYQSENALGPAAFPSLRRMESEIVGIALDLLHAPDGGAGNVTSGGTESILLAVKTCRDAAAAKGVDVRGASIVVPRTAHPAFDKAAHYLGLVVRRIPVGPDFLADVAAMGDAIDARTLMLVGSAPCFPYGLVDPIPALADLARAHGLWLHVDACVGGYLNPFAEREGVALPAWDFRVDGVASISADLHKYGYAAKGASTLLHRSADQHAHQLFHADDWPAGGMTTPTLAGTRPGGAIASAWAVLHFLGVEGYRAKARQALAAQRRIARGVADLGLVVHGDPKLTLLAFGAPAESGASIFAVWKGMLERGWFSGVVQRPDGIHLMLSPAHAAVAERYVADLGEALEAARRASPGDGAGDGSSAPPVRYS